MSSSAVPRPRPLQVASGQAGPSNVGARRDDFEPTQYNLTHTNFNMKDYPDPLRPRPLPDTSRYPCKVPLELENKWAEALEPAKLRENHV